MQSPVESGKTQLDEAVERYWQARRLQACADFADEQARKATVALTTKALVEYVRRTREEGN